MKEWRCRSNKRGKNRKQRRKKEEEQRNSGKTDHTSKSSDANYLLSYHKSNNYTVALWEQ